MVKAIGIYLGTTNSCVCAYQNGRSEVIANGFGIRTTPSCVAFGSQERFIGESAINQAAMNPKNTIRCAKRFIGRHIDDEEIKPILDKLPFKVASKDGNPVFQVDYLGEKKQYTPEEISAMILTSLKKTAEDYLGHEINDAVITVPAYFNNSQRQATIDAGKIAGLNVIRIINEPTAAAIAYGLSNSRDIDESILVYDFGGGTFDVTILKICNYEFNVLATGGDTNLGGEDIDSVILTYFIEEIKRLHGIDIKNNPKALRRLTSACERTKIFLSSTNEQKIEVISIVEGVDFISTLSVPKFNDLCDNIFKSTISTLEKTLKESRLDKNQIDKIILVGGSTRIPKIQKMVSEFFGGKDLEKTINPDEAVAYGASIQASILSNEFRVDRKITVHDVNPLSLGVKVYGGIMSTILEKNTILPNISKGNYTTVYDDQTSIKFSIYEGERKMITDNYLLGEFLLDGITPEPRRHADIQVTFDLCENGILKVEALDLKSKKSKNIKITNNKGRLSSDEIERMIEESERMKSEDEMQARKILAKNELEYSLLDIKKVEKRINTQIGYDNKKKSFISNTIKTTESVLRNFENYTKEYFEEKKADLDLLIKESEC
ncbi:Heat shock protein SSA3 [Smittium culicis]|uniref:Heat shock protein SSA3 n=1 Tax=Smittium culicis TaxID=133412 RepID=A0A1R1X0N8_9FUNG|nr:Heat shock protein SSA3 [Smittium culicis]